MSQITTFIYLAEDDVPKLGFWSKPQPRWFRSPECKFYEYLRDNQIRESVFDAADGVYVALVFAWLEHKDVSWEMDPDPVILTVRRNMGGDGSYLLLFKTPDENLDWFDRRAFDRARIYVADRISEIGENESLLITIG
jgi:hypothetical protein